MKFAFLAGALALGFVPAAANATLELQISDGINTQTLIDSGDTGALYFNGLIGSFKVETSTGIDEQQLGVSSTPGIDIVSLEVAGKNGGTLTFSLTETGITGSGPATFNSQIGGTQFGSNMTYATYMDTTNKAFGTGTLLGSEAITLTPFKDSFDNTVNLAQTYSMTEVVTIIATGSSAASFDAQLSVPEPMSLTILGAGLVALGGVRRRRQSASQSQTGSI